MLIYYIEIIRYSYFKTKRKELGGKMFFILWGTDTSTGRGTGVNNTGWGGNGTV
jgi:hypothetical protein